MSVERVSSFIPANIDEICPEAAAWEQAFGETLEARQDLIRLAGSDGLDLDGNVDHLRGQLRWVEQKHAETEAREGFLQRIADPEWRVIDTIGKASLVTSILLHTVQAAPHKPRIRGSGFIVAGPTYRGEITLRTRDIPASGAQAVYLRANRIVGEIKNIQNLMRDGKKVQVDERHRWSELRTARRAGNRRDFYSTTSTTLRIDDAVEALQIEAPEVDEDGVVKTPKMPLCLLGLTIEKVVHKNNRDIKHIEEAYTHSRLRFSRDHRTANVPMLPVMFAAGRDISDYVTSSRHYDPKDTRHDMTVKIGRAELTIPELEH